MSETFEEVIFHRYQLYPVDDELLRLLKKIRYSHVLAVLEPILQAESYEIEKINLRWVRFSPENIAGKDFRSPRTDNYHCVFLLEVQKGYRRDYAVYQLFSQKLYLMDFDGIDALHEISKNNRVQFVLDYGWFKCPLSIYTIIRRYSRCFKFEKRWFKDEMQLSATEDRTVLKSVLYSGQSLEEGFYLDSEIEKLNSYKAMYFCNMSGK